MTIVIDGDKVTVNGKPVDEYKSDDLDIISDDEMNYKMSKDVFALAAPAHQWQCLAMILSKKFTVIKAFLGVMTKDRQRCTGHRCNRRQCSRKSGVREDDIITRVNDEKIEDADDLYKAIGNINQRTK